MIGNLNAITYKEVFPCLRDNKVWLGVTNFNKGMYFQVPNGFEYASTYKFEREINGVAVNRVPACCWFANIEHGRRHQPLPLLTIADNLKFSNHKELKGKNSYAHYDNYDAIEVPYADSIPSDYTGIMGVPITFIDKYCPEQFDIIGLAAGNSAVNNFGASANYKKHPNDRGGCGVINGERVYARLLIRKKQ